MSEAYILNSTLEVSPVETDKYELRLPIWGGRVVASPYQVGVLTEFEEWSTPEAILKQYPFEKEATIQFLDACIGEGLLLPRLPSGKPGLPQRMQARSPIFASPRHRPDEPAAFTFLGIPMDLNTTGAPGARFGPTAMRQAGEGCRYGLDPHTLEPRGFLDFASGSQLLKGITLADAGDVFLATGEDPHDAYDRITSVVRSLLDVGTIPLILGGDHSITYPILRAFSQDQLAVIHLDAHTDLGDVEPAGLHHGNVFSMVLEKLEFVDRVYQIGLRGLIEGGQDQGHDRATPFGMDQVRSLGPEALAESVPADMPCYVSVDIDVLDPSFAPSTGTPVPAGMYPHELKAILRSISQRHDIVGMDLVEVGQPLSPADATAGLGVEALLTVADGMVRRLQSGETI